MICELTGRVKWVRITDGRGWNERSKHLMHCIGSRDGEGLNVLPCHQVFLLLGHLLGSGLHSVQGPCDILVMFLITV